MWNNRQTKSDFSIFTLSAINNYVYNASQKIRRRYEKVSRRPPECVIGHIVVIVARLPYIYASAKVCLHTLYRAPHGQRRDKRGDI